jgi:hypothetical protein
VAYGIEGGIAFQFSLADGVGFLLSYKLEVGKESGRYVATYRVRLGNFEHCTVKLVDI